jgi:hypothetical protein
MSRPVVVAAVVGLTMMTGACLQSTHSIPRGELMRLAQTDPAARGEHVRVIQDLAGEQPPSATPVTSETQIIIVPDLEIHVGGRAHARPPAHLSSGGQHHHGGGGLGHANVGGGRADAAAAVLVVAAIAGVALTVTEGIRYDGWVRLHPMQPVHLWGPGGYTVMPLAAIDPGTAAWAERAVVRPSEGPWQPLGRAPFDRHGFTYSVLVGAGQVASGDGSLDVGTSGRVQFGYFPSHAIGVQLDWGFAYRDNAVARTIFDSRLGLEATVAPLDLGPFHGGVFGGVALADRFEDGVPDGRDDGIALSGGALLQLSLTTRLALTARLGVSSAYGDLTRDVLGGLSIY